MSAIAEQTPYSEHTGNGVATAYGFEFEVTTAAQLKVKIDGELVSSADYSVSGLGVQAGGTVTFDTAPASDAEILIYRDTTLARTIDYTTNGPFPATTVNRDFNFLWMVLQEILAGLRRDAGALRVPFPGTVDDLPTLLALRGRLLGFDETTGQPEASTFTMTEVASTIAAAYTGAAGPLDALSFLQAGTGAVSRSPQNKLREVAVSIDDFEEEVSGGVVDANDAFTLAIAHLEDIGGGVLDLGGRIYLIDPGHTLGAGVSIEGRGGKLKFSAGGAHALTCTENNRVLDLDMEGPGTTASFEGFAFLKLEGASNVRIDNVHGTGGKGDGIRMGDTTNAWVTNTTWDVSRNVVSLNDDVDGSSNIHVIGIYGESYLHGFDAESDDSAQIVQNLWLDRYHFVQKDVPGATVGVAFTKDTVLGAGTFKKYRNINIGSGIVDGFFYAGIVRGADGVRWKGLTAKNCTRGMALAQGNDVHDIDISDFDLEVSDGGITQSGPLQDCKLRNGIIRTATGGGIVMDGASYDCVRPTVENVTVVYSSGASATGIRVTNTGQGARVVGNRVVDAQTIGLSVSAATGGSLVASGNTVAGVSQTVATGISISGSNPLVSVTENHVHGSVTKPISDSTSGRALVTRNRGADLFVGRIATTDATPTLITWENGLAYIPVAVGQYLSFEATISAIRTGSGAATGSTYRWIGAIGNSSGSVALKGTNVAVATVESDAATASSITADNTNDGLACTVTGPAAEAYAWTVEVQCRVLG